MSYSNGYRVNPEASSNGMANKQLGIGGPKGAGAGGYPNYNPNNGNPLMTKLNFGGQPPKNSYPNTTIPSQENTAKYTSSSNARQEHQVKAPYDYTFNREPRGGTGGGLGPANPHLNNPMRASYNAPRTRGDFSDGQGGRGYGYDDYLPNAQKTQQAPNKNPLAFKFNRTDHTEVGPGVGNQEYSLNHGMGTYNNGMGNGNEMKFAKPPGAGSRTSYEAPSDRRNMFLHLQEEKKVNFNRNDNDNVKRPPNPPNSGNYLHPNNAVAGLKNPNGVDPFSTQSRRELQVNLDWEERGKVGYSPKPKRNDDEDFSESKIVGRKDSKHSPNSTPSLSLKPALKKEGSRGVKSKSVQIDSNVIVNEVESYKIYNTDMAKEAKMKYRKEMNSENP